MEALLSKPSLKNAYDKEKAQERKRTENTQRCRAAREGKIRGKRKIPENLELTDDSIIQTKVKPQTVVSQNKSNQSSRLEMLREWKKNKEKQKAVSRANKVPFVVRHLSNRDSIFKTVKQSSKTTQKPKQQTQQTTSKEQKRGLQERNMNILNNMSKKTMEGENNFKRQSYTEWKKQQIRERPVTRATSKTQPSRKSGKTQNTTKNNQTNITKDVDVKENTNITEKDNVVKEIDTKNNKNNELETISDELNKTFEVADSPFTTSVNTTEDMKEVDSCVEPVQSFVSKPTSFEVPSGIAFTNFNLKPSSPFTEVKTNADPQQTYCKTSPETLTTLQNPDVKLTPKCLKSNLIKLDSNSKKTPISLFKEKTGIVGTPQQKSVKRTSLTPNPKNFLCKTEDPVAQRIESATKVVPGTPPDVSESVKHFSGLVKNEETKFSTNIEKWNQLFNDGAIPEEAHGNVLAAIGQAELFMRKRFKQFKELIELHKDKSAEKAAHASDLDGFWEMIYFQVDDVHKRFAELEKLQANNWEEEKIVVEKTKPVVKKVKKVITKKPAATKKVSAKRTDFKKFREQMMAKKLAEESNTKPVEPNGGFIEILAAGVTADGQKVITPVRRSLRNLDTIPKNSPGISMVIPADTNVACSLKSNPNLNPVLNTEEFSADSLEECSPDKPLQKISTTNEKMEEEKVCSVRRSTRKTPSKYRTVGAMSPQKQPEDVACNLFSGGKDDDDDDQEQKEIDFSMYLSKTVLVEDQPVKRDLLSSFTEPKTPDVNKVKTVNDLIAFSPLPQGRRKSTRKSVARSSLADQDEKDEDLLL